ncbi:MAG: hypothetical protein JWN98_1188 [Abditibacteriota bacterium]|nr:hypothetical protein [Abditibacteriota bacterium]
MRQIKPNLRIGIEYNPGADEVGFVGNWRAVSETKTRPAVIFGTSSDRIGTSYGQSYFATLSKSLKRHIGLPIAPYIGLSYSGFENKWLYPYGVNFVLGRQWSALYLHDGAHAHLTATYNWKTYGVTFLAVRRREVGLNLSTSF